MVIAGRDGNATNSLQALARELDIVDRVQFLGHRSDVADLMVAADVFVFPSLWEGLGGVLIEALALEVPIVSSDLDATREVLGGKGTSGLLVPPGGGLG
jgi:glycosyltransferase involved in cell wall biosynthesis